MKIKTRSNLTGWQLKLRSVYKSFQSFLNWTEMYGIHTRLGYKTPKSAWKHNPTIQGSVNPSDFCKVLTNGRKMYSSKN
jgi:hypothetical protein